MHDAMVMSTRAARRGSFLPEPGPTRFLKVPAGALPDPSQAIPSRNWFAEVRSRATWGKDARNVLQDRGDVLVFVWPRDEKALNDVEVRHDAKRTVMQLVSDDISVLAAMQRGWI